MKEETGGSPNVMGYQEGMDATVEPDADLESEEEQLSSEKEDRTVAYTVNDTPSWPLCALLGFQHYLTAFGSTLSVPLILAGPLCLAGDDVGMSEVIGTIFFVSGLATLLQTTFGIRLPIVQGATFAFLQPTLSILSLPKWQCPSNVNDTNGNSTAVLLGIDGNGTTRLVELGSDQHREIWQSRLREIQGAILVASMSQILLGFSGLLSMVLRYIGPLVIAPTVTLIGLCLFDAAAQKASALWWIALLTLLFIVLFSQLLHRVRVPLPWLSVSRKQGCAVSIIRLPLFELFPVLLAIIFSWLLCWILTITNALPSDPEQWGYGARTDGRSDALSDTAWIRVPYPGQWGVPTVSVSSVLGMLAGVLASMIESVGDYYACARLSGAPPPPSHALNRGIGVEGIACVVAAIFGSGNGTTSYSENVAAIGITKVASRRVVQVAGILLVALGCLGKVGAFFITIPDPVVGGMFLAMFAMITAVGLSNVRYVDLRKPRNMCVLGLSLFLGLAIPRWIHANQEAINTGSQIVDQIIEVLLSTGMFVGGFVGFVLDNLLPGTDEERGLTQWRQESSLGESGTGGKDEADTDVYSSSLMNACVKRVPCLGCLPFCPAVKARNPLLDTDQEQTAGLRESDDNNGVVDITETNKTESFQKSIV